MSALLLLALAQAAEPIWPWDTTRDYQIHAQMQYVDVNGTWVTSRTAAYTATLRCEPAARSDLRCSLSDMHLELPEHGPKDPGLIALAESMGGGSFTVKRARSGRIRDISDLDLPNAPPEFADYADMMVTFYGSRSRLFTTMLMCFDLAQPREASPAVGQRWSQRQNMILEQVMTNHTVTAKEGAVITVAEASRSGLTEGSITGSYQLDTQTGVLLLASRSSSTDIIYNKQMDAFPQNYEVTCTLAE